MSQRLRRVALATLALLVVALPVGGVPAQAQEVTPAKVTTALGQIDAYATQILQQSGVPGMAIAVVYKDQVVFTKGYGVRQVGTSNLVDADTIFQIASVSKPVASTVVSALVGDGVVKWDTKIVDLDPAFQMYEPWVSPNVTLADMFAHRSGLPDHAGDMLEDIGFSREQILQRLRYFPPTYSFRNGYAYTNYGLTEAGVAAAKPTGKTWEAVSAERLYGPAGMRSTSSRFEDYINAPNHASTHVQVGDHWEAKYVRDPDPQSPAGGVSSSARDMAQWMRLQLGVGMLDGKQIVDGNALGETYLPQALRSIPRYPATDRPAFYGLGWNVGYNDHGQLELSHSGAFALGTGASVLLMPSEQLGIIVMTNGAPIGVAEAVMFTFRDLATLGSVSRDWYALVGPALVAGTAPKYGQAFETPPAQPTPALPATAYTGTYRNEIYGDVTVNEEYGGLVMLVGPLQAPMPLTHFDGNAFTFIPPGENGGHVSGVTFAVGASGRATTVTIEAYNVDGDGTVIGTGVLTRVN